MTTNKIAELVRRCQVHDQDAERELFTLYAQRLTRLAEQHLSQKLASREDGEDVVQSVFRSFFLRNQAGEYSINTSSDFWNLVASITRHKVIDRWRRHTRQERDVRVEEPGEVLFFEKLANGPDPADVVEFRDLIETLVRGLPLFDGQVFELYQQGRSVAEMATQLGVSQMTIRRVRERLKQRLARLTEDNP